MNEGTGTRVYRYTWTLETVKSRCEVVGDCWLWKEGFTSSGLPQASIHGRGGCSVRTFVFDCLLQKTRPPKSTIAVRCQDKACVSPDCLYWRSRRSVVLAGHASGARGGKDTLILRRAQMIRDGVTKLDDQKVREIRQQAAYRSGSDLARQYGVSGTTVRKVIAGKIWAPAPVNSIFALAESMGANHG